MSRWKCSADLSLLQPLHGEAGISEKEIMQLRMHTHSKDIKIWRGEGDNFRPSFKSGQTWQMTRLISPEVYQYKCIWFPSDSPKF